MNGWNRGQKSEINPRRLQKTFTSTPVLPFIAMSKNVALQKIAPLIHEIRGERVILDSDLSAIYGVDTRSLVQAVKRNIERFPTTRLTLSPSTARSTEITRNRFTKFPKVNVAPSALGLLFVL